MTIDTVEYREAGQSQVVHHIPTLASYETLYLRQGLTRQTELWDWFVATLRGEIKRLAVSIILLDSRGTTPVVQWDLAGSLSGELCRREAAGDRARGLHPRVRAEVRGHREGEFDQCLTGVGRVSGRRWSPPLRPPSTASPTVWRPPPTACARSARIGRPQPPTDPRLAGVDPAIAAYVAAQDPEWFSFDVSSTAAEPDWTVGDAARTQWSASARRRGIR